MISSPSQPWKSRLAEIALIFAVFFLQGAWPVPDVNEPNYLGKAIHYWNPDWAQGDFFLQSADAHAVFYWTFGWLSLWLGPAALAWTGRILTWGLLAWAWRRLSWAVVPRTGLAALSGALFACFVERLHMTGEWVIGGVEAKGFAYVLVLLGLEALVRKRWNAMWLLFGGASLFHVLVGGWACVAAAIAWLWQGRRPSLRSMLPGLIGGFLIALPGLLIAMQLDWNASPEVASQSPVIYVFYRLPHHLVFQERKVYFILRFAGLIAGWGLACWLIGRKSRDVRLRGFVLGSLAIALVGTLLSALTSLYPEFSAGLLRFYWFRLADSAVSIAAALAAVVLIDRLLRSEIPAKKNVGKLALGVATLVSLGNAALFAYERFTPTIPRADTKVEQLGGYQAWREVTRWVATSGEIPPHARFLTPIDSSTFKWWTGRPEVVTRKEIPQDAASIVEWWARIRDIHGIAGPDPTKRYWIGSVSELSPERIRELAAKYGFEYLLTEAPGFKLPKTPLRPAMPAPRLPFATVYENAGYIIYRIDGQPR